MEGKKQLGSSSFVSDFFGSKEPTPSGLFGSIFAPQPKVFGRESLRSEKSLEKKQESYKAESLSKAEPAENNYSRTREEKLHPCSLSSSLYYGGQDLYASPQKPQDFSYSAYNKDGEDDSGSACRGNWWQGSLYY